MLVLRELAVHHGFRIDPAKLAAAVRRFADATTGDLVFLYNDIAVLRRRGGQGEYRRASPDFAFAGWTAVEHIQLPRDNG